MALTSLRQFIDYRSFLLVEYERIRRNRKQFTYGAFAKAIGLKTTSSLTKILHGERHPGPEITEKLVRYFRFEPRDGAYFRDLIELQKQKKHPARVSAILSRIGGSRDAGVLQTIDLGAFELVSDWRCFAVREMLELADFRADAEWIGRRLRFHASPREIEKAIARLKRAGLVEERADGSLGAAQSRYETTSDVPSEAIKLYHEAVLELARESVRNAGVDERELSSSTLSVKRSRIGDAKALIREFRERFSELIEEPDGEEIYQLQIQFFPLTRPLNELPPTRRKT